MMTNRGFWPQVLSLWIKNIWRYAKAQAKTVGIVFILLTIGLWLLDYNWAWLIALGISILDILPVIGAGIVFIPWVIIEWIFGDPSQGWWLLLLYLGVEIIQQLIEPFFLGKDLELPFWVPVFITIGCAIIFNVFGIVVSALLIPFISAYRQVRREYPL